MSAEIEQLIEAIIDSDFDSIRTLLQRGVDPNGYLDDAKLRPLHFAAQYNALEAAKLLITAGADISACTEPDRETPLAVAKLYNHKKFVDLLVRYVKKPHELPN